MKHFELGHELLQTTTIDQSNVGVQIPRRIHYQGFDLRDVNFGASLVVPKALALPRSDLKSRKISL